VARLGKGPLVAWILLHHLTRLKHRTDVTLPNRLLKVCGIGRDAKARALAQLERTGLISVFRVRGRTPRISLVELPDEPTEGADETGAVSRAEG
jgi:hypothetical protein